MGQKGQLEAEKWTDLFTARAWAPTTCAGPRLDPVGGSGFGGYLGCVRWSSVLLDSPSTALSAGSGTVVVEFFRAVPVLIMMIFFWLFWAVQRSSAGSAALHRRGDWSDPVQRFGDC